MHRVSVSASRLAVLILVVLAAVAVAAENTQSAQSSEFPSMSSSAQEGGGGGGTGGDGGSGGNKNNPRKLDGMDVLVIIIVTIGTLLSLFFISGIEFKLHRNRLHFAASNKAPRFSRGIVSEEHCKSILSEIYRTNTLVQQIPLPEQDTPDSEIPVGLLGWCFPPPQTKEGGGLVGFDGSEDDSSGDGGADNGNKSPLTVSWVHYKTTLSMMHEHFERLAAMHNPKNVRPPWMPFRVFAESVAGEAGKKFSDTYEEARYSPKEYGPGETRKLIGKMARNLQKAFPEESAKLFGG